MKLYALLMMATLTKHCFEAAYAIVALVVCDHLTIPVSFLYAVCLKVTRCCDDGEAKTRRRAITGYGGLHVTMDVSLL